MEKEEDMEEEEKEAEILKTLRMNGLVNSREEAIAHLNRRIETESDVIPVAYKAGLIQEAKSSVASEKRFSALTGFVNQKIKAMGREILDGRITVDPYKKGDRTACDYCPYHGICGFDLKTKGYGFRRFRPMKPEAVWEEIEKDDEEEMQEEGREECRDRRRRERGMGVNWTEAQRQVIESRNRNLLVSAAAGSGKTAVLVERIIEMITDKEHPGDIERLLVMTFTKAAAAEMRERIHDAVEKKLTEDPDNEYLQQQAVLVQYAPDYYD